MNPERMPARKVEASTCEQVTMDQLTVGDTVLVEGKPEKLIRRDFDRSSNELMFKTDKGNIVRGEKSEGSILRVKNNH